MTRAATVVQADVSFAHAATSVVIDEALVAELIAAQFPQWSHLEPRPLAAPGWDNVSFRLGAGMIVRLPRSGEYAAQVAKEHKWLGELAPKLPTRVPTPVGLGRPDRRYPWPWSIYAWIDGEIATLDRVADPNGFARALGRFLLALERIDPRGGPAPGPHNFHRGGPLQTYDAQATQAIELLKGRIDAQAAHAVWIRGLRSVCQQSPVWIHGDMSAGNILVANGALSGVIDFGLMGVGDPACDLTIAWTLFRDDSRDAFRNEVAPDAGTWARGRAWALWKASIVAAGIADTNELERGTCWDVLEEVCADWRRGD